MKIIDDEATDETILEIVARGKRGGGCCMSVPGAVTPSSRIGARGGLHAPNARLFPIHHRTLLNAVLGESGMKFNRGGNRRTAYSSRHSYICLRLMEGADIYQIAKNGRTSVEMIERYYAVHLQASLDIAAINTRRERPRGGSSVSREEPED